MMVKDEKTVREKEGVRENVQYSLNSYIIKDSNKNLMIIISEI